LLTELGNICGKFKSQLGTNVIDWAAISISAEFSQWEQKTVGLHLISIPELKKLTTPEKLAFWLNIWNCLYLHSLIAAKGIGMRDLGSRETRSYLFSRIKYQITDVPSNLYSLDDIEHGIIRGNVPPPMSICKKFIGKDLRKKPRIKRLSFNPLIHFGLHCNTTQSPPLKVFLSATVERELQISAKEYLDPLIIANAITKKMRLPEQFKWYTCDFPRKQKDLIEYIIPFAPSKEADLKKLMQFHKVDITFVPYTWTFGPWSYTPQS